MCVKYNLTLLNFSAIITEWRILFEVNDGASI